MASDKELLVIMHATHSERMMPQYLAQLDGAGIEYHIEKFIEYPNWKGGGTLGFTVETKRRLAKQFSDYQFLIFTCAFDMLFFSSKAAVLKRIPTDYIVMGAEKNCYPVASIASQIPERGPWRFSNGGPYAGTPDNFLKWCDAMESHRAYNPNMLDQELYNIMLAEDNEWCQIDFRTNLFFCLFSGYEELEFRYGHPYNSFWGTYPAFIHANGQSPTEELFEKYERSLK